MNTLIILSPLLFVAFGGLAVMMADAFSEGDSDIAGLSAAVLGIGGLASLLLLVRGAGVAPEFVSHYLSNDPMAYFVDVVVCSGAALSALLAGGYNREHGDNRGEFHIVLIFSAFGAMVLGRSADLLTLFLGLETMSLGVYCLVGFRRTSERSAEGAIKYFLLGSFAAAILLFGCATLYGATGHTDLAGIGAAISGGSADPVLVSFSLLMLIVGLAFKVSAVPFHQWTPDAYEGAATPATTFMAVAVKSAAFAVLVRVLVLGFGDKVSMDPSSGWPPLLAGIAAITMVYGNIAAVAQTSVKRMLAYSSIAHAGYILVALVAVYRMGSEAISAVLFYLAAYTVSNVLAFGSLILVGSHGK